MNAWILYTLWVLTGLCLPLAYAMGHMAGAEQMKRSMLRHPSISTRKRVNRIDVSA